MSDLNGGKRTVKRRPASKSARATPRKPKTKAKRKSRSRTTSMSSKYSEEPHTRVQEGGAKRKAGRKAGRKTSHSAHESRSGVKELAVMGDDRLRMGLVPSLPLQLMLDPELKRKVAMADPRVSDIFSKYGPGWSGYQLGLQSNRNMPVVELESQIKGFPAVGMDLQSHPLAGYLRGSLGPFTGHTGPFGPSGPRNPRDLDALAASAQLGTNVKVMDMDRLPEDALDVKGEISPFGVGLPDAMRVAGLSKQGRVPRPGQLSGKPESGSEPNLIPEPTNPIDDTAVSQIKDSNNPISSEEDFNILGEHVKFILYCNRQLQLLLLEHNANKVQLDNARPDLSTGYNLTDEQVAKIKRMVSHTYFDLSKATLQFAKTMCDFFKNLINARNITSQQNHMAQSKGYLNSNALKYIETNSSKYCGTEVSDPPPTRLQPQDQDQFQAQLHARAQTRAQTQTQTQTQSQSQSQPQPQVSQKPNPRIEVKDTPSRLNVTFNNAILEIRDLTTDNYSTLKYMRKIAQTIIPDDPEHEFFKHITVFWRDPKNTVFISNYLSDTDLSKENLLSFIKSYNRFIYEIWILNSNYARFYRLYNNIEILIQPEQNELINMSLSDWRRIYINGFKQNDYK